jgi:aspartyl-tRNA(Asn)/glutamyl-tRNA(Gln) amidotransferase subunit C
LIFSAIGFLNGFFTGFLTGFRTRAAALTGKSPSCQDRPVKIEELRETAALAHLNLDENELKGALSAFEEMLGYFAVMQAADSEITGPAPGISAVARTVASGCFRADAGVLAGEDRIEGMLDNAGERDGRFVVVPNVL